MRCSTRSSTSSARRGRVSYRALKLQFQLDDDALDDLKEELIYASTCRRG